jgi:hypothetical protein
MLVARVKWDRSLGPKGSVEESEGGWCGLVIKFLAIGNGQHCLLEVCLVVYGGWRL